MVSDDPILLQVQPRGMRGESQLVQKMIDGGIKTLVKEDRELCKKYGMTCTSGCLVNYLMATNMWLYHYKLCSQVCLLLDGSYRRELVRRMPSDRRSLEEPLKHEIMGTSYSY